MPDPIQPPLSRDEEPEVNPADLMPKPRGKSGFNPLVHEEEMATREEATRLQELPIKRRMFKDVTNVLKQRLKEPSILAFTGRIVDFEGNPSGERYDLVIASISCDKIALIDARISKEPDQPTSRITNDDSLVIVRFVAYKNDHEVFPSEDEGIESPQIVDTALVLSAEGEPIIAIRVTDTERIDGNVMYKKKSWMEVISNSDNKREVTEQECESILALLRKAKLKQQPS